MNPNNQVYYSSANGSGGKKRLILIVVLVVLILGALAYLIFGNSSGNPDNGEDDDRAQTSESAVFPLTSLSDFSFKEPDMKGYIKRSDFTIDVGDYTTPDNSCNLQFGIVPAAELPGNTAEQIAAAHMGATAESGAVGAEPKEGADLKLKSTKGSSEYVMPTLEYEYTRDNVNYKAYYSVVILAENQRAFVRRYCANESGQVARADMTKINNKAKEIKVDVE